MQYPLFIRTWDFRRVSNARCLYPPAVFESLFLLVQASALTLVVGVCLFSVLFVALRQASSEGTVC